VRSPARILVVDDNDVNVRLLTRRLASQGYEVVTANDGESAMRMARELTPDLMLLDVMMPKLDGREVCRRLKADPALPFMPIIMVTALTELPDVVAGLDAGADDYLTKPIDHAALEARVRSMLRIKQLHDTVNDQARELAAWNATLEQRVREQLVELEHVSRLKRFFSPQLAERIVAAGADDVLPSHRRHITAVFVDLRGFTAFAETSEPEEVSAVLREYHAAAGHVILAHEGTWERFTGDGLLVFFNDPIAVPNPEERAVRMTLALRDRVGELRRTWERRECDLDFAAGIASGYATLGAIGFEGRWDYTAIGSVTGLATRLCAEAGAGDVIVSQRVVAAVDDIVVTEPLGSLALKGFHRAVSAFRLVGLQDCPPRAADNSAA
jgi:DNA-binding response OmpR family regulator